MSGGGGTGADRPVIVIGAGLIAVAAIVFWQSWALRASFGSQTLGPQMMPYLVSLLLLLFGALTVIAGWKGTFPTRDEADWTSVAWITGGLAVMILLIKTAGFVPARNPPTLERIAARWPATGRLRSSVMPCSCASHGSHAGSAVSGSASHARAASGIDAPG